MPRRPEPVRRRPHDLHERGQGGVARRGSQPEAAAGPRLVVDQQLHVHEVGAEVRPIPGPAAEPAAQAPVHDHLELAGV
ncbi:hypothetical protein G6F35_017733 [Rhizopus arrhizus]|nr:hypothetical protein G6F35_017733 [Rhizopus arrhizus]